MCRVHYRAPRVTARYCLSPTMGRLAPHGEFAHLGILTARTGLRVLCLSSLKDGSDFPAVPKRPCGCPRQARRKVYLSPPMLFLPPAIVENKFLPHPECLALWEERGNITHSTRPNTCCVKASGGEDILESALGKGWDGNKPPDTTSWGLRRGWVRTVSKCLPGSLPLTGMSSGPQKRWAAKLVSSGVTGLNCLSALAFRKVQE